MKHASIKVPWRCSSAVRNWTILDTSVPGLLGGLEQMDQRLSIDDFGTGYASLVYLQRLPVVEVKIDRSFVTPLGGGGSEAALVRSIVDLAHNLSLTVVAEGVEDEKTLDRLIDFGCDAAQGYYFSRAVPADEIVPWLEESDFGASPTIDGSSSLVTPLRS